jgi:SAM-dependent methyltransferase
MSGRYSFDASWEGERQRLAQIEAWLDPHSIRAFEELGVQPGWRCLDVGAGSGSITQWLCDRVGPAGSVVAVDADTRFLEKLGAANLEVMRADVVQEDLPEAEFDFVHTRLLLQHLPERERVLEKLVRALRPGGRLMVLENGGTPPQAHQQVETFERYGRAMFEAASRGGWALDWAPLLPQRLLGLGLEDVRARAFRDFVRGGSTGYSGFVATSAELLRDRLIGSGLIAAADVDATIAMLRDPACTFFTFECWIASGRGPDRPEDLT